MFILGLDGGGTKTQAVILQNHIECGRIFAGGINYNSYPKEQIKLHLSEITQKCAQLGFRAPDCGGVGIGAAGISHPEAADFLKESMRECGFTCPISVMGDHEAALRGGLPGEAGILLIAGTGSVCLAQNRAGELYKVGGCGHLIDDGGSAYAIGRDMMRIVVQAHDDRCGQTQLTQKVFQELGINSIGELISYVYDAKTGKKEIAHLAGLLTEELIVTDMAAQEIALNAVKELIWLLNPAVLWLGKSDIPLLLAGGVLEKNRKIRDMLMQQIEKEKIPVYIAEKKKDAAYGAAAFFDKKGGWQLS